MKPILKRIHIFLLIRHHLLILLAGGFLFISNFMFSQKITKANPPFAEEPLLNGRKDTSDNIIIYGDSFLFSIHKPMGWHGDVDNVRNYNANIIFYKNKEDVKKGGTLIQILTYKKTDEEVNMDLEQDIIACKEKNHDLKQQNLDAAHKEYASFSKFIFVDKVFYQYIVYINPGENFGNAFSVTMNISKRTATKEELRAFRDIISSLVVFKR